MLEFGSWFQATIRRGNCQRTPLLLPAPALVVKIGAPANTAVGDHHSKVFGQNSADNDTKGAAPVIWKSQQVAAQMEHIQFR